MSEAFWRWGGVLLIDGIWRRGYHLAVGRFVSRSWR